MPEFHHDPQAGHREHAEALRAGSARRGAGDLIVRAATVEEYPALAALHAEALPPGWSAASIASLMQTAKTETLVAVSWDIDGFVMVRTAADEAEILTIATRTRRRGFGRALLEAAIADARANGARTLHLDVASDNDGARKFYARAGFVEIGRRARYYLNGADALLLSLAIA